MVVLDLFARYPFLVDGLFWIAVACLVVAIAQRILARREARRGADPNVLARLRWRTGSHCNSHGQLP